MRSLLIILSTVIIIAVLIVLLFFLDNRHKESEPKEAVTAMITIREGSTILDINKQLFSYGVLDDAKLPDDLEGYLFPDTYEFYVPSDLEMVKQKFIKNFNAKVPQLISKNKNLKEILTVASIIEKEVPDSKDRLIVSGIIWKRLERNYPLQIDATVCYIKKPAPCSSITKKDFSIDSPYNTYLNKGLPPGPISNPGLDSIKAALNPKKSQYWFYLSDPKTNKTIFSVDLDEHNQNIVKYLSK